MCIRTTFRTAIDYIAKNNVDNKPLYGEKTENIRTSLVQGLKLGQLDMSNTALKNSITMLKTLIEKWYPKDISDINVNIEFVHLYGILTDSIYDKNDIRNAVTLAYGLELNFPKLLVILKSSKISIPHEFSAPDTP